MKKIIFSFAFMSLAMSGYGQQDTYKNDVVNYLKVSGASSQLDAAKKQILMMLPEDKKAEFTKEFDSKLPAYYDLVAKEYMNHFTHDDIKQLLAFYNTPIGKKLTNSTEAIGEGVNNALQEWGMQLQEMFMKYMQ